jgi:hypothetical protein
MKWLRQHILAARCADMTLAHILSRGRDSQMQARQ